MQDDQAWGKVIKELKSRLPVNQDLKSQLRQELLGDHHLQDVSLHGLPADDSHNRNYRRRAYYFRVMCAIVAVACIVLVSIWGMRDNSKQVTASSLHLYDQYSVLEQLGNETSEGMAEYDGILYLPMKEKGLFQLDSKKLTKLIDGNINYVRVSPDGKSLAYVQDGSLYVYDIKSATAQLLLSSGDLLGELSFPSWSPDGKEMLFVSQQKANNYGEIMRLTIADKQWEKVTIGYYPAYVSGQDGIFFERNNEIVYRDLATNVEQVFDSGTSPAVSNDGAYVAYIKSEGTSKVQNLWIADTNFTTKKQITSNQLVDYAYDPDTGEYLEGKQQAQYTLEQPVWSNQDNRLYVYKVFHTNETWRKLTRLQLSTVKLTPSDTVGNSIAALIYRDEEYAHSFFNYDPGYLKGTSPRQVGYHINSSEQQGDKTIVNADTYLAYYDPYYRIEKQRYTVEDTNMGYKISAMESIESLEITDREEGIYLTKYAPGEDDVVSSNSNKPPKERTLLLHHDDIPSEQGWVNGNVNSLQYNEAEQHLFATLSRTRGDETKIVLLDYDLRTKAFKEDVVWNGRSTAQTSLLQISPDQRYAAITVELGDHPSDIMILELSTGKIISMTEQVQGINNYSLVSRYWNEDKFIFYAETKTRDVFFSYNPSLKSMTTN